MANKFLDYDGLEEVVEQIDAKYAKIALTLPSTTKYGASLDLNINSSTYVVTVQLKDQDGNNLGTAQTIDLPIESVVVSGSYDAQTKEVVLTLQSGSTIRFSVADLVSGLQSEITSSNKLSADLVSDTSSSNKFVTASEKTTWNGKQDALTAGDNITITNNVISADKGVEEITSGGVRITDLDSGIYKLIYSNPRIYYNGTSGTNYVTLSAGQANVEAILVVNKTATIWTWYVVVTQMLILGSGQTYIFFGATDSSSGSYKQKTLNNIPNGIADNLTTNFTGYALDAHQGYVLKQEIDTLPDTAITIAEIDELFS